MEGVHGGIRKEGKSWRWCSWLFALAKGPWSKDQALFDVLVVCSASTYTWWLAWPCWIHTSGDVQWPRVQQTSLLFEFRCYPTSFWNSLYQEYLPDVRCSVWAGINLSANWKGFRKAMVEAPAQPKATLLHTWVSLSVASPLFLSFIFLFKKIRESKVWGLSDEALSRVIKLHGFNSDQLQNVHKTTDLENHTNKATKTHL